MLNGKKRLTDMPPPPPNSTPRIQNVKYADVIWQNRHQGHLITIFLHTLIHLRCLCHLFSCPIAAPPCSLQHLQHPLLSPRTNAPNHPSRNQKPRPPAAAAAAGQTLSTHRSSPPLPLFSPPNSAPPSPTTNPKPKFLRRRQTRSKFDGKRWKLDNVRCPKNVFRGVPKARWRDRFVGWCV